jgi:Beta propeller domain
MKIQTAFVLLAAVTSAAAMGCGPSSDSKTSQTGTQRASLHRAKGCGDLLSDLKDDATFKLNKAIDRQIEQIQKCIVRTQNDQNCVYYGGYYGGGFGGGPMSGAEDSKGGTPPATPTSNAGSNQATSHSETNNQVAGVDEADFVKTDGKNLYVIHGRSFKVLKAWPANDLAELSSLDIEGQPSQMFVDGGKVVVYSQVNGASIYKAAGVPAKEQYNDYMMYGSGGGMARAPSSAPDYPGGGGGTPEPYIPLTKITVLTLDGATPSVVREMYFEGSYLDSRRVGTHVRTVLSGYAHGPKLKYGVYELYPAQNPSYPTDQGGDSKVAPQDPGTNPYPKTGTEMIAALQQLRAVNKGSIDASQLSDWLPYTFTKNNGTVQASSVACEDFYVPSTGSAESGLTEVASIDLANPSALPRETAILGHAETVYGSADTLYLATQAWVEPPYTWQDDATQSGSGVTNGGTAAPPPGEATPPPPSTPPSPGGARPQSYPATPAPLVTSWAQNQTHIHKFEFATDAGFPNYVASGTVVGTVKDQFSMDDRGGYLRVATSENRTYLDETGKYVQPTFPGSDPSLPQDRPSTVNHVFVLGATGPWLDTVGDVGELGNNEQIRSVRFLDGRGYVVTFRQVDPLFVLDLANPKAPTRIAELTIPGFSEYMHPLDATHIMTIGRDGTDAGQVRGLKLQIFDVANGANPVLTSTFTYSGTDYGQSDAEGDHKAFTYFADQHMLAFPFWGYNQNGGPDGPNMHSSLELFKVDAGTGFAKLGSIDHTDLVSKNPTGYCGGYYAPTVRRGVFLDNFVFSISYGGVVAKDATNLAGAGAKLALPSPQVNDGYGPACGGI